MNADWYVDPLDRFDGRYFDGEQWTEQVSHQGRLTIDPDFPPPATRSGETPAEGSVVADSGQRAGKRVGTSGPRSAASITESPVRVVAVLESRLLDPEHRRQNRGRGLLWLLVATVAALVVVGLLIWRTDNRSTSDVVAAAVPLTEEEAARVEDLATSGETEDAAPESLDQLDVEAPDEAESLVDPDAVFDASESIDVGALSIANGVSLLEDLSEWHASFALDRGVELGPEAGCWFGELNGAALQVATCGPVAESGESEFLFDLVPLVFDEDPNGRQVAQPVVDAVTVDAVLANALTLIGVPDGPAAPLRTTDGDD